MKKQLHRDSGAEREANEVAKRFMNSTDVAGDMSRAFGANLSSVRIHTDESAARRVEGTGADAFSTGRDIFFARGAFDQSDPASRGLLAHELTHSMQQGIGGETAGVQQAAPEGAAQGGLLDWFRSLFGRKKEPEMQFSEPQLISGPGTGPVTAHMTNDQGDSTVRSFQNSSSYALNQMLQGASREQLQDPALRRLVLEDYNTNMNARLRALNGKKKDEMDSIAFRRGAGELNSLNMVLGAMVPEDFGDQVMNVQKQGGVEPAIDYISDYVEGNQELMDFIGGTNASFEGVDHYESAEERSMMMMNNLMLRSVNGQIGRRVGMQQRARYDELKKQGITGQAADDEVNRSVDRSDIVRSGKLQKEMNKGTGAAGARLRNLMAGLFRRR